VYWQQRRNASGAGNQPPVGPFVPYPITVLRGPPENVKIWVCYDPPTGGSQKRSWSPGTRNSDATSTRTSGHRYLPEVQRATWRSRTSARAPRAKQKIGARATRTHAPSRCRLSLDVLGGGNCAADGVSDLRNTTDAPSAALASLSITCTRAVARCEPFRLAALRHVV
jgi:hypothetical protein